ncbi:MAG: hypothetical protein HY519_03980 [Candidatus Aenigmarchaeota archaeon]|nr:hypothetical protein [Candidatus Aenigmarchaeota archaeon]
MGHADLAVERQAAAALLKKAAQEMRMGRVTHHTYLAVTRVARKKLTTLDASLEASANNVALEKIRHIETRIAGLESRHHSSLDEFGTILKRLERLEHAVEAHRHAASRNETLHHTLAETAQRLERLEKTLHAPTARPSDLEISGMKAKLAVLSGAVERMWKLREDEERARASLFTDIEALERTAASLHGQPARRMRSGT